MTITEQQQHEITIDNMTTAITSTNLSTASTTPNPQPTHGSCRHRCRHGTEQVCSTCRTKPEPCSFFPHRPRPGARRNWSAAPSLSDGTFGRHRVTADPPAYQVSRNTRSVLDLDCRDRFAPPGPSIGAARKSAGPLQTTPTFVEIIGACLASPAHIHRHFKSAASPTHRGWTRHTPGVSDRPGRILARQAARSTS